MNLRRYFKPASSLPSSSQTDLPANVLLEVNQAVTAVLQGKEAGTQGGRKRKYTTTFTPEDRALKPGLRYSAYSLNSGDIY